MAFERARLEFGMELAAEEPWMVGQFHYFDQIIIGRSASGPKAGFLKCGSILIVDFQAMTMALSDAGSSPSARRRLKVSLQEMPASTRILVRDVCTTAVLPRLPLASTDTETAMMRSGYPFRLWNRE